MRLWGKVGVGSGLLSFPSLTSVQGALLLSALYHGVMWYFFRKEGPLSMLVIVGLPTHIDARWRSHFPCCPPLDNKGKRKSARGFWEKCLVPKNETQERRILFFLGWWCAWLWCLVTVVAIL